MRTVRRGVLAGVTAATACLVMVAGPAVAHGRHGGSHGDPVRVVAEGLNGPFQLAPDYRGGLFVTEVDIGQVTRIDLRTGKATAKVTNVPGAAGAIGFGSRFAIITGEADPSAPPPVPGSSVLLARPGGTPRQFADLMEYELENNPDGQIQFDAEGIPLDALSNPFNIVPDRSGKGAFIVADAGANTVLRVGWGGKVSTLFVPPVAMEGECATRPNNTTSGVGCDPVPTGLAYGPGGLLYVATLGAEAPGAGKVYVLNPRSGKVLRVIKGLDSPTGVAVDTRGNVYVSNVVEGAPAGEPGPDFDPSTVGDITKIGRNGSRSVAQVTMPNGLLWKDGSLYASAWSIAGFLGIPDAGQVVKVSSSAFERES